MIVRRLLKAMTIIILLVIAMSACDADAGSTPSSQQQAEQKAKDRKNYSPQNDVEGHNYNARQQLSDNPATIIWCSVYPTNPNVKPFTVPIVGKLTSGNKRPYATTRGFDGGQDGVKNDGSDYYTPEVPGPDGFYGTSGEYRYGFDPAGNYHDFYNMETYCTSVPSLIQQNTTQIDVTVQGDLEQADKQAEAALEACRKQNPDPSVSCDQAAQILGVK